MSAEFDRSKWHLDGASPDITAEEGRRAEVCESYIRSASWHADTPDGTKSLVAMNVRGAWPVAYTQGFKDGERNARAALEKIAALRPDDFKSGDHPSPAFREVNFRVAFKAVCDIVNEYEHGNVE